MSYNLRRYIWNLDHKMSDLAKNGNTINKQQLTEFLDAEVISDATEFRVSTDGLEVANNPLTIKKSGYLIKTNLGDLIEDSVTLQNVVVKEINFGWLIDKSFVYTNNKEIWAEDLYISEKEYQSKNSNSALSWRTVKWNSTNQEWEYEHPWRALTSYHYQIQNNLKQQNLTWAYDNFYKTVQQSSTNPFFIVNETAKSNFDSVFNSMSWSTTWKGLMREIVCGTADEAKRDGDKLIYQDQDFFLGTTKGTVIRVNHVPARDLQLPQPVHELVKRATSFHIDTVGYDRPWGSDEKMRSLLIEDMSADEITQYIPLLDEFHNDPSLDEAPQSNYGLFNTYCAAKLLYSAAKLTETADGIYIPYVPDDFPRSGLWSKNKVQEFIDWMDLNPTKWQNIGQQIAEINIARLTINNLDRTLGEINIDESVFVKKSLHFKSEDMNYSKKQISDSYIEFPGFTYQFRCHPVGAPKVREYWPTNKTGRHSIIFQINNWVFSQTPEITYWYKYHVFDERIWNSAEFAYSWVEGSVFWKEVLINPDTSDFLTTGFHGITFTPPGAPSSTKIPLYASTGCWDLLNHRIVSRSAVLYWDDYAYLTNQVDNQEYLKFNFDGNSNEAYLFKDKEYNCYYFPSVPPTTSRFSVTSGKALHVKYKNTHRAINNGNVAAVAAYIIPSSETEFNSKITYGYFWISNAIYISYKPGTRKTWVIGNFSLNDITITDYDVYEGIITLPGLQTRHIDTLMTGIVVNNIEVNASDAGQPYEWIITEDHELIEIVNASIKGEN